jgi:TPP-dependent pyruvate/acetoin dehydrogenase alpha subunit
MQLDKQLLLEMYYQIKRIRRFEETAEELFKRGTVVGLLHTCIGQEAVAAGACLALSKDDYITCTHRGHGQLLAKDGDMRRLLAELCGRATGYCRGKGGSIHIANLSQGVLGATGVVGAGIGIATGAALSAKKRKSGQVTVCFFGDGAANQGLLMEAANMAALWQLPVVYLCENNRFGEYTRYEEATTTCRPTGARVAAFGIPAIEIDGNDVLEVYREVKAAVDRARAGEGPAFIEAHTYRLTGHHMGDVGFARGYRTSAELEERWKLEPIGRFRRWLLESAQCSEADLAEIDGRIETEIQQAVDFVGDSPWPEMDEITEHVYA